MSKGLFITGTGTDVGKTYVTALLTKALKEAGYSIGYYKAALSGASSIATSDAGYVKEVARLEEADSMLVPYVYEDAVSPHLAARWANHPVEFDVVMNGYDAVAKEFDCVVMEGSGGIVCPIREDEECSIMLTDFVKALHLPSLVIANAGLGTINAVVTTISYMRQLDLPVSGILLNHWTGSLMEEDNIIMIEKLTGIPVIGVVREEATQLEIEVDKLIALFQEAGR